MAVASGAFVQTEAEIGGDQRFDPVEEEIVELRASLTSDLEGVFETGGGDQGCTCTFTFEQSVGADSRPMEQDEFAFVCDFAEGLDDGLGRIGGS